MGQKIVIIVVLLAFVILWVLNLVMISLRDASDRAGRKEKGKKR